MRVHAVVNLPHAPHTVGKRGSSVAAALASRQACGPVTNHLTLAPEGRTDRISRLWLHRRLVRELYMRKSGHVDPSYLLRRLAAINAGENFCDGGQHDCEELLSAMMDRLHEDLVQR